MLDTLNVYYNYIYCDPRKLIPYKVKNISSCCLGKLTHHKGKIFLYKSDFTKETLHRRIEMFKASPIHNKTKAIIECKA